MRSHVNRFPLSSLCVAQSEMEALNYAEGTEEELIRQRYGASNGH